MPAKWTPWAIVLVTLSAGAADASSDDDPWKPYRFLAGEWTAEGSGDPGKGSGGFSFAWDLQEKVLVRRNRAEYPATPGRPASSHEDLMVIYRGESGGPTKAIYFDSEGHVINYTATFSQDKRTLTFLSDAAPAGPRFRLSYTQAEGEVLRIKFEIAPPGKPDAFRTYLEGSAHRQEGLKPEKSKK
jgi:hypothetical protein